MLPAEVINLDRVIDDQIGRADGVDGERITAEFADGVAHGGEIDQGGDTGKVLQDHSGRFEGNFNAFGVLLVVLPVEDLLDIDLSDVEPVAVAHGRFQKDSDGVG